MSDKGRVAGLRETFAGEVILPGDSEYDGARQIFNAMHDRRVARAQLAPTVIR